MKNEQFKDDYCKHYNNDCSALSVIKSYLLFFFFFNITFPSFPKALITL